MRSRRGRVGAPALAALLLLAACAAPPGSGPVPERRPEVGTREASAPAVQPYGPPGAPAEGPRLGDEIVVCGRRFHAGTRVVLWTDPGGYDATSTALHFGPAPLGTETPPDGKRRYHPGRRVDGGETGDYQVPPGSEDLAALREAVDLFVLHYDVCGTSQQCFKVLHDRRALSVHFLLDADGTIYQTLDLRERAWHAGHANTRSVGVEIAQIGSRALSDGAGLRTLEAWYPRDAQGRYLRLPEWMGDGGMEPRDAPLRPARPGRVDGPIQGHERGAVRLHPGAVRRPRAADRGPLHRAAAHRARGPAGGRRARGAPRAGGGRAGRLLGRAGPLPRLPGQAGPGARLRLGAVPGAGADHPGGPPPPEGSTVPAAAGAHHHGGDQEQDQGHDHDQGEFLEADAHQGEVHGFVSSRAARR